MPHNLERAMKSQFVIFQRKEKKAIRGN